MDRPNIINGSVLKKKVKKLRERVRKKKRKKNSSKIQVASQKKNNRKPRQGRENIHLRRYGRKTPG